MSNKGAPAPKIVYLGAYEGDGDFPDHRHEDAWELLYLREGAITERSGENLYAMEPGAFVVHPPGVVHGDTAEGKYFLYHVLVTSDRPLQWPKAGREPEGGPIGALLGMVVEEWYNNFLNRESFLRHAACLINICMKRCASQEQQGGVALAVVTQARGIFRREFRQPIDFENIAVQLHISRSTLYAYFHTVLGRTPQEELERIRLQHAVYLLRHSQLPIGQIAKGSGFCSSSHLARKLQAAFQTTARGIREGDITKASGRD